MTENKENIILPGNLRDALTKNLQAKFHNPLRFYVPNSPTHERFDNCTAKEVWFMGANRSGKTTANVVRALRFALGEHPTIKVPVPNIGRFVVTDAENGIVKILMPELERWAPKGSIAKIRPSRDGYPSEIYFRNGSVMYIMRYTQDKKSFEGSKFHWCAMDEPMPRHVYTACKRGLVDYGGHFWATLTVTDDNPDAYWIYDEIWFEGQKPEGERRLEIFNVDIYSNPHLDRNEVDAFVKALTPAEREARACGRFVQMVGRIYGGYFEDREPWVIDSVPIPYDYRRIECVDPSHSDKPWVVLFAAVDSDERIIIYDEINQSGTISDIARAIEHKRDKKPALTIIGVDSQQTNVVTGVSMRNEFAKLDISTVLATRDVEGGIHQVKERLKLDPIFHRPKLVILRNCIRTRHDMMHYLRGRDGKPAQPHSDAADCLRYICQASPITRSPFKKAESIGLKPQGRCY